MALFIQYFIVKLGLMRRKRILNFKFMVVWIFIVISFLCEPDLLCCLLLFNKITFLIYGMIVKYFQLNLQWPPLPSQILDKTKRSSSIQFNRYSTALQPNNKNKKIKQKQAHKLISSHCNLFGSTHPRTKIQKYKIKHVNPISKTNLKQ